MKTDVDRYRLHGLLFSSSDIKVKSKRCFHGKACEMKLTGQLTLANQAEVLRRIELNLVTVNAALLDLTGVRMAETGYSFREVSLLTHDASLVLVVTQDQRPDFEAYMQSRTRQSLSRMIFTDDLISKARSWTEFYSRLGIQE
jgi:serine/threonine protein kinase HipA of HipAB toxin-antitoxin module